MHQVLLQLLQVCPHRFVNERASYGWTPLHQLCNNVDQYNTRSRMVSILAQHNADLELGKGPRQTPPLCIAASTGNLNVVYALLVNGANPQACNTEGTTAKDCATVCRSEIVWALDNVGAPKGKGVDGKGRLPIGLLGIWSGLA